MNIHLHSFIRLFYTVLTLFIIVDTGTSQDYDLSEIGLDMELKALYYDRVSPSIWLKAKEGVYSYDGKILSLNNQVQGITAFQEAETNHLAWEHEHSIIIDKRSFDKASLPTQMPFKLIRKGERIMLLSEEGIWEYKKDDWDVLARKSGYERGKIIDAIFLGKRFYYAIGNAVIQEDKTVVLPHKVKQLYTIEIKAKERKILVLTEQNQLYIIDNSKAKNLILPDAGELTDVIKVYSQGYKSYFMTKEKVYVFNAKDYSTKTIAIYHLIKNPVNFCVDRWDNIWLANDYKLVRYHSKQDVQIPYVKLGQLASSTTQISKGETLSIQEDQELLRLPIEIYGFQNNDVGLLYRWDKKDWTALPSSSPIHIHPIPEGKHELYIAMSMPGESPKVLGQYFTSSEPRSKYYWIWFLVAGLGAVILLLLRSLYHYKASIKENQLLAERNSIRQESKTYQKEILKLQMNPHFLYNSLNSISGLIASGESAKARKSISHFSKLMRRVLDQSREKQISLEEELRFLRAYFELENISAKYPFDYKINIDSELDQEELIPSMIIQPFIENAIVHGVSSKKDGMISVEFSTEGDYIKVIVDDNGVGRASTANSVKTHKSAAMDIVKERLTISAYKKGRYHIADKSTGDQATGTKVTIFIPKI